MLKKGVMRVLEKAFNPNLHLFASKSILVRL